MKDPFNEQPRRRIVLVAKMEADDWKTLQHDLMHLATEIARHGKLSTSSCSGGYSSGHIIITSEDGSIDHDSWAKELDSHLTKLKDEEPAAASAP
jgi:hypothetical protein